MSNSKYERMFTLARRELQEYRNSLLVAPLVIAVGLILIMLLSIVLSNRFSLVGDTLLQASLHEESAGGINIDIQKTAPQRQLEIQQGLDNRIQSLNPVLNLAHNFFLLILFMVTINYLLATLYSDRKDQSILFWRSMPVSETQEVLSKFAIAMIVAPIIFIAVSLLLQVAYILMAMLWVWRSDMDPFALVLGNIDFLSLLFNQIAGWLLTALWLAPIYAWLLLASAAAKRSPFFFAIAPVIALVLVERVFIGTRFVATTIGNHLPNLNGASDALGFYSYGPYWASVDYLGMFMGLLFAALALAGAVYLRRYRFEI